VTEAATRDAATGVRHGGRPAAGGVRPRSGCSVKVLDAALAIADAEGFEAVSMRRVAERAGVGTMTLYSHVRDKEELLDLMHDSVMAEQHLDEVPTDWRSGLTAIARLARASYLRHPWLLRAGMRPHLGTNGMIHVEQSLAVTARLTDDLRTRIAVMAAVDDFVLGCTLRQLAMWEASRARGEDGVYSLASKIGENPLTRELLANGRLPHVADAIASDLRHYASPDDARFERELGWLLDGIAADLGPAGSQQPAD
jgi:AcrR family transcriptional regulator